MHEILVGGRRTTVVEAVERVYPFSVFGLVVRVAGRTATLTGAVASERARLYAAEIVAGQARVDHVVNRIEVTAVLTPATDLPAGEGRRRTSVDVESVVRYPSIRCGSASTPGNLVDITVDLALERDGVTDGEAFRVDDAPADWEQIHVKVTLVSDLLDFEEGDDEGEIIVRRGRGSRTASFTARLRPEAIGHESFRIHALFTHDGRQSGYGRREFPVAVPAEGTPARVGPPSAGTAGPGSFRLRAEAAGLTVSIIDADEKAGRYTWVWHAHDAPGIGKGACKAQVNLGGSAESFAREKLGQCPQLVPGRHDAPLRGIGAMIWDVTPREFKDFYGALLTHKGPGFSIQIMTDEPHVPWELMCPDVREGEDMDHLYLMHPVARWALQNDRYDRFHKGRIVSFVPTYSDGSDLPWAAEEGRRLVDRHDALALPATHAGFSNALMSGVEGTRVSALHFAGHGRAAAPGSAECGLRLDDGWYGLDTVRDRRNRLGGKDRCLVILNACQVGQGQTTLGLLDGWPGALMKGGFGGVLAPLWSVEDEVASRTVLSVVAGLMDGGKTLGEAMLEARREFRALSSTPYAFIPYGDVTARMGA